MNYLPKMIGERIRNFRKRKGLSQEELGYLANLHASYIGQLERGEKNATLESIGKISKALEVSLEELFHSVDPKESGKGPLEQIVTTLQGRSKEDQAFFLEILLLMFEWKEKKWDRHPF